MMARLAQRSALPPSYGATGDTAWRELHRLASEPYRRSGKFGWHFARGKLGRDPVFRSLLERGDITPQARVLDIGCGQGLLASLFCACDELARRGAWPAHWASPPTGARYTGIEMMPRDVARANSAIGMLPSAPQVQCADMCHVELPAADAVVILDALHYVDHTAQAALLLRVRAALAPRGRLVLRVGDAARRRRFVASQWVDRVVTWLRGHRAPPTFCRKLTDWTALLQRIGFEVEALPMSQGTPFANVLLCCNIAAATP
jgi:cyclopropane fatty-acyl-phospholipid synthase-like methyltransferase